MRTLLALVGAGQIMLAMTSLFLPRILGWRFHPGFVSGTILPRLG